ncbi:hypothetical protein ACWD7Y_04075 [Streptomyces drozdowiczii]
MVQTEISPSHAGRCVAILALLAVLAGCSSDNDGIDKRSYEFGYNEAFGGANIPTDTRTRDEIEASCGDLYGPWSQASGKKDVVRDDWVQGCADVAQNKDSRF